MSATPLMLNHQEVSASTFSPQLASSFALGRREQTLADQLAEWMQLRIDDEVLKPGARLPSIRRFASERGVSRSTVVDAYDRLIAAGYIESRPGSGFYVNTQRRRAVARTGARPSTALVDQTGAIDVVWLLRNMLRQAPAADHPGAGLLPASWLDSDLIGSAVRSVGRYAGSELLTYGVPEGYLPLRQQLSQRLAYVDINASAEQIVTTNGVTQAIDLVARHLIAPGDTVFVEDPAWYVMFGRFAAFGAKVIGVPRAADGPDANALAALLTRHQPKLFVIGSVLHNPTSTSISAANAHRLLGLAEQYRFTIVEDDVYGDLHPGRSSTSVMRLASLDQLRRVIYVSGFSKTLAANLRVGFIACAADTALQLADLKMLTGLTTPELSERVVARILAEGHYRRHLERLRAKLDAARDRTARVLEKMGARLFSETEAGMFLWANFGCDTNVVAAECSQRGILCAPGSLFSPNQSASPWMRISVAAALNPNAMNILAESVARISQN